MMADYILTDEEKELIDAFRCFQTASMERAAMFYGRIEMNGHAVESAADRCEQALDLCEAIIATWD